MKNYVISLKNAKNRREHISQQFSKQDIDFKFFDAVTPINSAEVAKKLAINITNTSLSPNEIGCLLSHVSVWQHALASDLPYIGVFEDDIYLSKDAHMFLSNSQWIDRNWHIVKVEKINAEISKMQNITKKHHHTIGELKSPHLGGGGYILSKHAAQSLLAFVQNTLPYHVDQLIFNQYFALNNLKIYQINPTLCIQDCILYPNSQQFTSYLQWRENQSAPTKITLTGIKKLKRELTRPFKKVYLNLTDRKTKLIFIKNPE